MNKILMGIGSLLLVSACASNDMEERQPIVLENTILQEMLIPIDKGPKPNLLTFQVDVPRDRSGSYTVKNTTECIELAGGVVEDEMNLAVVLPADVDKRIDEDFWKKCGEWPVILDSNIFLGFDQENWNILMINLNELREYIIRLESRIDIENERRERLRERTQEVIPAEVSTDETAETFSEDN